MYVYRQLNSIFSLVGGLCFTCEINAQKPFKCDSNSIIRSSAMRNGRLLFRKIVDFYSHQCACMMRDHVNYTWPSKMCDMKRLIRDRRKNNNSNNKKQGSVIRSDLLFGDDIFMFVSRFYSLDTKIQREKKSHSNLSEQKKNHWENLLLNSKSWNWWTARRIT